MKQTLRLISRFFLMTMMLVVVLGALVVLSRYVTGYDPDQASPVAVVTQLAQALREVFVVSLTLAAALSIFATLRVTNTPFLTLMVLGIVWSAMLVVANSFWPPGEDAASTVTPLVPEARVVRVSGVHVYSPQIVGTELAPVIIHEPGKRPGTRLYPRAILDSEVGQLTVPGRDGPGLGLNDMTGSYAAMVSEPARLSPLVRDIRSVNGLILQPEAGENQTRLLFVIVFGIFLLACWTPARLTRWPLFNALLVFLCIRGAFWLVTSIHYGGMADLLQTAVRPDQFGLVSAGTLLFVSVVFIVALLLLPPLSSWKREVGDV